MNSSCPCHGFCCWGLVDNLQHRHRHQTINLCQLVRNERSGAVDFYHLTLSIATTAIFQQRHNAFIKAAQTQVRALKAPLQAYRLDLNNYPTTSQGLEALRMAPGDLANPAKWSGPYLEEPVPLDPWDQAYRYAWPGTRNADLPDIWSVGPDGVDGTDDDVGNWLSE